MYYTSYLNFKYLPLPFLAFKAKRSIRITNGQLHVTISSEWPLKTFSSQSWVVRFCKGLWSLDQIQESIRIHSKLSRYTTKYYKRDPLGKLSEIIALFEHYELVQLTLWCSIDCIRHNLDFWTSYIAIMFLSKKRLVCLVFHPRI